MRHGDTVIWAGQTNGNAVTFPPGSTLETLGVQAFAPGDATLTVSFTGTGALSNYTCQTSVDIRAVKPDIILVNDYSGGVLIRCDPFGNKDGKKWVVATFPEPKQVNIVWNVRMLGKDSGTARIKYQRGTGPEIEIGGSHDLRFINGELNAGIRLNDGPGSTPTTALSSGILTISGVHQGDRIIVEDTETGSRDEIAVVKNFTWNDLQRIGGSLTMHPDFNGLHTAIKEAIIETVLFCLDASPTRAQHAQLSNDTFPDSGLYSVVHTNFHATHPDLLKLDIPSARSIGYSPHDFVHFHLGLELATAPAAIENKRVSLLNVRNSTYDNGFQAFQAATVALLVDLMNSTYDYPLAIPFLVFHSYEDTVTFTTDYLSPGVTSYLRPGDPIRNVRWPFIADASPLLTYPGQEHDASFVNGTTDPPVSLYQIDFFVNRRGEVVLVAADGHMGSADGMVSDALQEE